MRNMPFRDLGHNRVWLALVLIAHDLIAWTQRLLLTGELARCEPKRLRYRLLHVAARLAFHAAPRRCASKPPGPGPRPRRSVRASTRSPHPPANRPAGLPRSPAHPAHKRPQTAARPRTIDHPNGAHQPQAPSQPAPPRTAQLASPPDPTKHPHHPASCTILQR